MRLAQPLIAELEVALGARITELVPLSGGSINAAYRVMTERGPVFVKTHADPPVGRDLGFFAAEADGLARLAVAVPVPEVLWVSANALALSWVEPGRRTDESERRAGLALAALHTHHGPAFGLAHDNFMGAVPQDNRAPTRPDFASFFRERRLAPLAHHLPIDVRRRLDRLPLDHLLTEPGAPSLIHGDLWGGNLLHGRDGPCFIDPAVCYGHPEQDLAMTRLFGGFSDAFYAAYREASGLVFDRDLEQRLEVLTLYPLLIHVALFGGGYLRDVAQILERHG